MEIKRNAIALTLVKSKVKEKLGKDGKPSKNSGREYYALPEITAGTNHEDLIAWLGDEIAIGLLVGAVDTILQRKWFAAVDEVDESLKKLQVRTIPELESAIADAKGKDREKLQQALEDATQSVIKAFTKSVLEMTARQEKSEEQSALDKLNKELGAAKTEAEKKMIRKKIVQLMMSMENASTEE